MRKRYIAVDFDGTLCEHAFPEIGKPYQNVIQKVKNEAMQGSCIIIWTCRSGEYIAPMVAWLKEHRVPFHYVNENPECDFTTSPKIYADEYWDDRAVNAASLNSPERCKNCNTPMVIVDIPMCEHCGRFEVD